MEKDRILEILGIFNELADTVAEEIKDVFDPVYGQDGYTVIPGQGTVDVLQSPFIMIYKTEQAGTIQEKTELCGVINWDIFGNIVLDKLRDEERGKILNAGIVSLWPHENAKYAKMIGKKPKHRSPLALEERVARLEKLIQKSPPSSPVVPEVTRRKSKDSLVNIK